MSDEDNVGSQGESVDNSMVDDIFGGDRNSKDTETPAEEVAPAKEKVKEQKKAEPEKPVVKEKVNEPKSKAPEIKEKDEDDEDPRAIETDKLKKALQDSQKWGHTNNRRLKKLTKIVNSLKEQDLLSEDESNLVKELLNSDAEDEQPHPESVSSNPFVNLVRIADKRISDLEEIYEDDPLFHKKSEAFSELINNSTKEEKEDILDELEELKDKPLKLAKKMYAMGEKFYEEFYKDIDQAGGIKGMVSKKNEELAKMQKKLDKLTRELSQYKGDDKPTYKIDESGDTSNLEHSKHYDSFVEEVIGERDRNNGR